jgi:hypothetical protein
MSRNFLPHPNPLLQSTPIDVALLLAGGRGSRSIGISVIAARCKWASKRSL